MRDNPLNLRYLFESYFENSTIFSSFHSDYETFKPFPYTEQLRIMASVNFSWFVLAFCLLIVLVGVVEAWVNIKPVTGPDYDGDYALPPGTGRFVMGKCIHA